MINDPHTRRMFIHTLAAAGVTWAATDLTRVEEALAWAVERRGRPGLQDLQALTPAQAADVEAMAARIIPSDDGTPGAREAGVIHFIDRALATFNAGQKKLFTDGIADANRRAAARFPGKPGFAALTAAQQDALLHDIEQTPFFQALRFSTIAGMFALPTWGGNRDYIGWRMIGLEHQPSFQPPFGFYDAEAGGRR